MQIFFRFWFYVFIKHPIYISIHLISDPNQNLFLLDVGLNFSIQPISKFEFRSNIKMWMWIWIEHYLIHIHLFRNNYWWTSHVAMKKFIKLNIPCTFERKWRFFFPLALLIFLHTNSWYWLIEGRYLLSNVCINIMDFISH